MYTYSKIYYYNDMHEIQYIFLFTVAAAVVLDVNDYNDCAIICVFLLMRQHLVLTTHNNKRTKYLLYS